jgi:hypothetical protein
MVIWDAARLGCVALKIGGRVLVRVGVASVAAGSAGLTLALSLCAGILLGREATNASVRPADVASAPPARVASLSRATFDTRWAAEPPSDTPATTASVDASFDTRFSSEAPAPVTRSLRPSFSFSDRFATGATVPATPPARYMVASVPSAIQPVPTAAPAPAPHAAARALLARVGSPKHQERPGGGRYRIASLGDTPVRVAYAPADSAHRDGTIDDSLLKKMTPHDLAPKDGAANPDMSHTAIYDITAHAVYLPNGRRLEAHSGLGDHMDDLGAGRLRDLGPTPPGVYDLTMREARFHGIDAIRLNPVDNGKMYGRAGILAHPYMLGPNGQSNGCVSFKDYDEFLAAFRRGEFNRMVVVQRLDNAPGGQTTAGWIADKLRGLFGQS